MRLSSYFLSDIYIYFFSVYSILFFWFHNFEEAYIGEVSIIFFGCLSLAFLVKKIFNYFFEDKVKTNLITVIFLIMFFTYGHLFNVDGYLSFLRSIQIFNQSIGRYLYTLSFWIILFMIIVWAFHKSKRNFRQLEKIVKLNVFILVLFPISSLIMIQTKFFFNYTPSFYKVKRVNLKHKPNIYYIIFDAYARADVLKNIYNYNNENFIKALKKRGFFIADQSCSNYTMTHLSIPSSMNMEYLNSEQDWFSPFKMMKESKVLAFIKQQGYKTINIASGWGFTDRNYIVDLEVFRLFSCNFIYEFLHTTLLAPIHNYGIKLLQERRLRIGILDAFESLSKKWDLEPFFLFCHMVTPHEPHLFEKDSSPLISAKPTKATYLKQISFLNNKIIKVVDDILEHFNGNVIIIIQSDHGPNYNDSLCLAGKKKVSMQAIKERLSNLSLFYLPEGGSSILYPTITPVNIFRLIFNYYFGANFEKLEDISYWSDLSGQYMFKKVEPNRIEFEEIIESNFNSYKKK